MLESAIAAGVTAAGGDALLAGVLPTPAAPLLVRRHGLDLAAVISASHNPYEDNGIKLFAADGFKLDDDTEHEIEARARRAAAAAGADRPRRAACTARSRTTCASCTSRFAELDLERPPDPARLRQRRHLPRRAGDLPPARRRGRGDRRRARRAQHQRRLRLDPPRGARRARCARATTTSASRSTATATACSRSTATATVVDGDELIALAALHLRDRERLPGNGVAVTVMTNYGFHTAMAEAGDRGGDAPPSATATCSTSCAGAAGRSAASSPATSSSSGFGPSGDGIASALLDARGARRRATCASATRWRSCPSGWSTSAPRPRGAGARDGRRRAAARRSTREADGARGPRPRARARLGHRAADPRDGRGAERRGDRRRLRPAHCEGRGDPRRVSAGTRIEGRIVGGTESPRRRLPVNIASSFSSG